MLEEVSLDSDGSTMARKAAENLHHAGLSDIGLRNINAKSKTSMASTSLPWHIVTELNLKRNMEANWKLKCSTFSSLPENAKTDQLIKDLQAAEETFLLQKQKVSDLFFARKQVQRTNVLRLCSGNSIEAKRKFWSYVTRTVRQSGEIEAVVSDSGSIVTSLEDINFQVERHLIKVFNGSLTPITSSNNHNMEGDHTYSKPMPTSTNADHSYCSSPSPKLPSSDHTKRISSDPSGWLDKDFSFKEVSYAIKKLKCGKAVGLDGIPNDFLINAGKKFWLFLVTLFNKVKKEGVLPPEWNQGKVTLIHKKGQRENLGNYRPITVINSLSGLYSRLLNERLSSVVEKHKLIGEYQNGFRKGRTAVDNSFVLNTILSKQKYLNKKVHMAFIDLVKVRPS